MSLGMEIKFELELKELGDELLPQPGAIDIGPIEGQLREQGTLLL